MPESVAPPARFSWLLILLDLLLALCLLVLPLAWFFDPLQGEWGRISWGWKPVLAPLLVLVLRTVLRQRWSTPGTRRRGLLEWSGFKKLAFAWTSTFIFFAATEGVLGLLGVEKAPAVPIVIRGQEDQDTRHKKGDEKVIVDPELLWRFSPLAQWDGVRINEHGFRTRPFTAVKAPGTRRVIALGDSCTAQGEPPYSDRLHQLLQENPPTPESWEAFNTGVFGYSIEQGYRQFMKEVRHFQPDVVTIYFGWNDHWLNDRPDRLRLATRLSPAQAALARAIQNKRLFSVLTRSISRPEPATATTEKVFRVPVDDYADTMTRLVEAIRATGAQPLILTAPRRSLTPSVVRSGHASAEAVAEQAHDQYMDRTRELAARLKVPLLDLAREFAGPEYDDYFSKDGIHFDDAGLQAIAQRLLAKLSEMARTGQLPPATTPAASRQ